MKILILGAGGQLAKALIDYCCVKHIRFKACRRHDLDITDLEQLKREIEKGHYTHIVNCAAFTDVDEAEKISHQAYAVNGEGPENLGMVARENGIAVVHVSTDYVFDGEKQTPYSEEDRPNPLGVYGKSKWEGEQRLLEQLPTATIIRTSWVFGRMGKNFISCILEKLHVLEEIQAVDDQINRATYNRDLAKVLIDLSCHSGIFHFANETALSRYQIVQDFYQIAKERKLPIKCQKISPISLESFASLSPRPKSSVLDTQKVTGVLGRKPRLWETVLGEYFDHVAAKR